MDREITLRYTPQLVRAGAWRFWSQYFGIPAAISVVAVGAAGIYFWATEQPVGQWLLLAAGFGAIMFIIGGLATTRRGMSQLRRMAQPLMNVHFTDAQIEISSDLGKAQIPWSVMRGLKKYSSVWLLIFNKWSYMTVPVGQLDGELQGFLTKALAER